MTAPLEVRSLVKRYGDANAVDGVSFEVPPGRVFCLLGPNGAGKTTTLEMCMGVRVPTSGTVRLLGQDPRRAPADLKRRIGVLPQRFLGFESLTVRENVQYFADVYGVDPDVPALLASLGLAEEADKRYRTLSGGTKRRVGIATALVNDPEVLFLDEPTAGVDPASRRQLWDVIVGLRSRGCAIVLTTHYMDEAERLSDHVAIIRKGRIVASGTPEQVRMEHGGGASVRIVGLPETLPEPLASRPGLVRDEQGVVTISLRDAREGPVVLAELVKSGASYKEITVREPSLDDAFIRLVGPEGAA